MLSPKEILQHYWGYADFRNPQEEIIDAVLEGKDTLAILPTGGGKSLCYQIPALILEGMTLVISPLIALMQDQVNNLNAREIGAELITSQLSQEEIAKVLARCTLGKVKLLYVAPERLQSKSFLTILDNLPIQLIAVDEAHCIAQWGHDFRPAYKKIHTVRERFPKANLLALTATAPPKTLEEIIDSLELKSPQVFKHSLKRKNLIYRVIHSQNELDDLEYELKKNPGAGLVFCRTRKQTYEIAQFLLSKGLNADFFHARLPKEEKKTKQENWTLSKDQIMVATNAFGMGIDKPDVRTVIHMDFPNSLEAYIQEAGRAGRDEKKSEAVLFLQPYAIEEAEKMFKSSLPTRQEFDYIERMFYNYFEIGENERPVEKREFNWHDFIQRFNLNKNKSERTLFFLERKEVITFQDRSAQSGVQVYVNPNNLPTSNSLSSKIINSLVRRYPGILGQEMKINEYLIARDLHESAKNIKSELHKLNELGYLNYRTKDIQLVDFLRPRESNFVKNNLWKEFEAYQIAQWKKLQDIIFYASQMEICREKLILRYFGESPKDKCGACDVCKKEANLAFDSKLILDYLEDSPKSIQQILLIFSRYPKETILESLELLNDEEKIDSHNLDIIRKI